MGAFTPGPWRWEVNEKCNQIQLCGGDPKGGFGAFDLTVMDFERWGMRGAAPRFVDRSHTHPILARADTFAVIAPYREHHASWFKLIDNPDANLIASAPDILAALRKAHSFISRSDYSSEPTELIAEMAAALAKAGAP